MFAVTTFNNQSILLIFSHKELAEILLHSPFVGQTVLQNSQVRFELVGAVEFEPQIREIAPSSVEKEYKPATEEEVSESDWTESAKARVVGLYRQMLDELAFDNFVSYTLSLDIMEGLGYPVRVDIGNSLPNSPYQSP